MPDTYSPADEPRKIGHELIKKHHDHLSGRRVDFLFIERKDKDGNSQAIIKGGKNHYGDARLKRGLDAYLAGDDQTDPQPFFVITITKHFWDGASDLFKRALIDHELCHCEYDSEHDKYSLVPHDVEDFVAIVKRWGLWEHTVETFVKVAKQQSLAFESEPTAVAAGPTEPTPKVRRIRGAKNKDQANQMLGG
jgi:hypothetical protein